MKKVCAYFDLHIKNKPFYLLKRLYITYTNVESLIRAKKEVIKLLQTGDVIRRLRMENKYTQSELAIMLGLQLSTLQKYESGAIVNIKLETLKELCEIFEVPPIVLVFPNLTDKDRLRLLRWCIKEYSGLNNEGINKVLAYIDDMVKIYRHT